jgi:hypothetical protein
MIIPGAICGSIARHFSGGVWREFYDAAGVIGKYISPSIPLSFACLSLSTKLHPARRSFSAPN